MDADGVSYGVTERGGQSQLDCGNAFKLVPPSGDSG